MKKAAIDLNSYAEYIIRTFNRELGQPQIPTAEGWTFGACRLDDQNTNDFYTIAKTDNCIHILLGDCQAESAYASIMPLLHMNLMRIISKPKFSFTSAFNVLAKSLSQDSIPKHMKISLLGNTIRLNDNYCSLVNVGGSTAYFINSGKVVKKIAQAKNFLSSENHLSKKNFKLKINETLILLNSQLAKHLNESIIENLLKQNRVRSPQKMAELFVRSVTEPAASKCDLIAVVVAAKYKPKHFPRVLTMENTANALPHMRSFISSLLGDYPFSDKSKSEFLLCIDEALANAIRHGQSPDPQTNSVTLKWAPLHDCLLFEILDNGIGFEPDIASWKPPSLDSEKGRGIFIMKNLLDKFEIKDTGIGTKVILAKKFVS